MGSSLIEPSARQHRARQQDILAELGGLALRAGEPADLMRETARLVALGLRAELCVILQRQPPDDRLLPRAAVGWPDAPVGPIGPELAASARHAIEIGEPVVSDASAGEGRVTLPSLFRDHGVLRALDVVIWRDGATFGVIEAGAMTPGAFDTTDVAFAQAAANLLGVSLARRQSDAAVAEGETRTRDILENIRDGFYVLDRHWRFTYLNRSCEEWCGRRREQVVGKSIWDVFPQAVGTAVQAAHFRAAREKCVVVADVISSLRPRWIEFSIHPSSDGLAVYFRDIDERKRAELALRDSEERLRLATESAGLGTWELDLLTQRAVRSPSHAAIFGTDPAQPWTNADFMRLVLPPHRKAVEEARQLAFKTGTELRFTCRIRRAGDGALRWIDVRGAPVRDPAGAITRYLGVVADVTERKEAEALRERLTDVLEQRVAERTRALAEANTRLIGEIAERKRAEASLVRAQRHEATSQLVAGVAHAFNNLLTTAIGSLELLALGKLPARRRRHLERAMHAAVQAGGLTHKLVAFAGQQQLAPRPVDANAVLIGMQETLLELLGRGIRLRADCAPGLWTASGDPEQLRMIVQNLVINAREAMPHGGHISLGTRNVAAGDESLPAGLPTGDYVMLSVTDDGAGMPPDVLARACEPFFTTKRGGRGLGLGLAQVDGVARELGGALRLRSTPRFGTTVELFLPRTKEEPATDGVVVGGKEAARVDH
jgi:PAS domain S-box-containing protein